MTKRSGHWSNIRAPKKDRQAYPTHRAMSGNDSPFPESVIGEEESSNHLLETIFSSIHTLIAYMDTNFNFIRVNRAYAEADGHEPDYFIGKNHFALYPDRENESIFRRVVETGEPYTVFNKPFESPLNPERGITYWDWSAQPVNSPSGEVGGIVLILADVTERVQAELALKKSQVMFEHLFESAPDANILVDHEGRIVNLNRQTETRFGYTRGELIGKPVEFLLPSRYQGAHQEHRNGFALEPRTRPMGLGLDLFGRQRDGTEFPVDVTLSPLNVDEGFLVLAVVRDISHRKEVEWALVEQTRLVKLLQDIAIGANNAETVEEAVVFALDRICLHTSWPIGHAYHVYPDGQIVSSHSWHVDDRGRVSEFIQESESFLFQPGKDLPGRVVESGEAVWFNEVVDDPGFLRQKTARSAGIRSGFAFPILVGRE